MNYRCDIYQGHQLEPLIDSTNMLDESSLRRLKNILSTVPRLPAWSDVVNNGDEEEVEQLKVTSAVLAVRTLSTQLQDLTNTFLNFISGRLGHCSH